MQQITALLDDEFAVDSCSQHHGAEIQLHIDHSAGMTEKAIWEALSSDSLAIYTGWPKRTLDEPQWLPSTHQRSAKLTDIYSRLKPRKIGQVSVLELVKVNDSWVLHGKIHYDGGHITNHAILQPFRLIVQSMDKVRGQPTEGRVLVKISKVRTDPL